MNDSTIIIDSSALFSLEAVHDSNHVRASKIVSAVSIESQLLIPAEIFAETVNSLWKKTEKEFAYKVAKKIIGREEFQILETGNQVRGEALKIFANQKSKLVSFTDCLVMAFADRFKTRVIFGFDESFKKNGYLRLGIDLA